MKLVTAGLVGVFAGAVGGFSASIWAVRELRADIASRPPVAILDVAKVVQATPGATGEAAEAHSRRILDKVSGQVKTLSEAGYVVLDSKAVLGAPEDLYIPAE
ncbi:MAG: hypothetical protein U1F76_20620 [Candidatus Competibacteraceae bacterium]